MSLAVSTLLKSNPATCKADGRPIGGNDGEPSTPALDIALSFGGAQRQEYLAAMVRAGYDDCKAELIQFLLDAGERDRRKYAHQWPAINGEDYLPALAQLVMDEQTPEVFWRAGIPSITHEFRAEQMGVSRRTWFKSWRYGHRRLWQLLDIWCSNADRACFKAMRDFSD
jgi:hypothetical protein